MVFLFRLCLGVPCFWDAVSSIVGVWLALLTEQSRCLMDFENFDQSALPEVISLPHPTHLPLYLRLINIHSVGLFSAIIIKSYNYHKSTQVSFNNLDNYDLKE
jgi:hypothetical protein